MWSVNLGWGWEGAKYVPFLDFGSGTFKRLISIQSDGGGVSNAINASSAPSLHVFIKMSIASSGAGAHLHGDIPILYNVCTSSLYRDSHECS